MVEILAYAFGIMYTPGPVNLLSLNTGLNAHTRLTFCVGVGSAMLLLFLLFGYTGAWLVSPKYQIVIGVLGCIYIAYLAFKVARANVKVSARSQPETALTFRSGLIMQLLNPKAPIAILPITTVQFPAADISGISILLWSLVLATIAFGAPTAYMLMGRYLSGWISKPSYFRVLNLGMAVLLFYVAGDIAYSHVFKAWI
ncbi:LysE family transporter [Pontibacterium granulatum]|uniref:LysE family translocator n=1 Tax=Pontibacterium granulatum TaxID=2036029 RepID=UPI00249AACFC|nr:LysE family transporter [Pontibacterium granulatum]MDI3324521.1 LysE family transporter [Pontibacterium granulatum]